MEEKKIIIAIAEDHEQMREMVASVLKGFGFDIIIQAKNGNELLDSLTKATVLPDVCLLDINMPGLKGDKVAEIISRSYPEIKIAALTGNRDTDSLIMMIKSGSGTYLLKSSNPKEWKKAIEGLVMHGYYCTDWMAKTLLEYIRLDHYPILSKI